jgi:hypothetical protein
MRRKHGDSKTPTDFQFGTVFGCSDRQRRERQRTAAFHNLAERRDICAGACRLAISNGEAERVPRAYFAAICEECLKNKGVRSKTHGFRTKND